MQRRQLLQRFVEESEGGFLASSRVVLTSLKGADEFRRVPMFSKRDKPENSETEN